MPACPGSSSRTCKILLPLCYGLNCFPYTSSIDVLSPRTSECDCLEIGPLKRQLRYKEVIRVGLVLNDWCPCKKGKLRQRPAQWEGGCFTSQGENLRSKQLC